MIKCNYPTLNWFDIVVIQILGKRIFVENYRETGNIKRISARFHTRSNLNREARKQSGSGKTETLLAFIRRWFVYRFGNSKLERYKRERAAQWHVSY